MVGVTADPKVYAAPLERAHPPRQLTGSRPHQAARSRRVSTLDALAATLGGVLPDGPTDPAEVVDLLAAGVEPGLMNMGSGRFYGWVIGGTLPAALAADWLVSAWDQNTGMRFPTPGRRGCRGGRRRVDPRPPGPAPDR